jgi:hypothetical protein
MNCTTIKAGLVVAAIIAAGAASAAQRTFVSTQGVDNPACSLAAPCRAFAAAIAATSPGGEVIVQDSGGYGPVSITQAVSIVALAGVYAGISVSSGDGVTINAPGSVVRLVGLTITGLGGSIGINILAAARASIERCQTTGMTSFGIFGAPGVFGVEIRDSLSSNNGASGFGTVGGGALIVNSRFISNTGDGVNATDGAFVFLRDVDASRNSNAGVMASSAAGNTRIEIEGGTFTSHVAGGVQAFASGSGTAALDVTRATISGNLGNGIVAQTTGANALAIVAASANTVSATSIGLAAQGTNASIVATGNTVSRNTTGANGGAGGTVFVGGDNSILLNTTNIGTGVSPYTRN